MQPTTIVTLGNPSDSVSSFDDAYGDYSEARGRGRARRKKRKLERIANRKEVRAARQEARKERKVGRQEVKQAAKEARIAKRQAAQAARQAKRLAAMQARQEKRTLRKEMRLKRQEMGDTPEMEMDETMMTEVDSSTPETTPSQAGDEAGASESQDGGYSSDEQYGGMPTSQDEQYGPTSSQDEEWGGGPPAGMNDEEGEEEDTPSGVYQQDNDDDYGAGEGTGEESDFDGIMGAEDRFYEMQNASKIKINPAVAEITRKIEWNKELISKLRVKKAKIEGSNGNPNDVNKQIAIRTQRIMDLETQLQQYAEFEGDYSLAEGVKPAKAMYGMRMKEINAARNMAMRQRRNKRRKATPVAKGLNPQFSPNKIVVPAQAKSNFSGQTGVNGLDLMNDYDAPDTRIVELTSNADGKTKVNWVGIGIGVGVAVLAIWGLRKYKVI